MLKLTEFIYKNIQKKQPQMAWRTDSISVCVWTACSFSAVLFLTGVFFLTFELSYYLELFTKCV